MFEEILAPKAGIIILPPSAAVPVNATRTTPPKTIRRRISLVKDPRDPRLEAFCRNNHF